MSDYLKITWTDNKQVENRIRSLGLDFTIRQLKPSEINVAGSRELQTRFETKIDEEHALTLALQVETSKRVERLVCFPSEIGFSGELIADGNHRHFLLDDILKDKLPPDFTYEVYYIDTQDKRLRELIARSFNCIADKKVLSESHRIRHIQYMHDNFHMPIAELAKFFGVREETVNAKLFYAKQRDELHGMDVPADSLKDAHIKEICKIKQNDPLKQKFANLVAQYKPTVDDARLCVNQTIEALTLGGEPEALKMLGVHKKRWIENFGSITRGKRLPKRTTFFSTLEKFYQFLKRTPQAGPFTEFHELGIADEHDVSKARQIWKETKKMMETILRNWDANQEEK
jgi:hypothetical protein